MHSFLFPFPPLPEQKKIASILSTVDAKLEKITAQIDKTQELKKGLSQHLLTRGIGHTEFKESKIGEVPASWEVVKLGQYVDSHSYGPRFNAKDYSENGNVQTIRGTDVSKDGTIHYEQVPVALLDQTLVDTHKLQHNDLVMITTADCGLTAVFKEQELPFIPSAYAVRVRLKLDQLDADFIKYLFQTEFFFKQVDKFIRKGTVANLPGSDILKFKLPYPPIEEQTQIASILSTVDQKLSILERKKSKVAELKKGLMQGLLSGKVRVREEG